MQNFDTFCPMGPCIVTRDELPDWGAVRIQSRVNGELRQDALVTEQLCPPPAASEWLSSIIMLSPATSSRPARLRAAARSCDHPASSNPATR